VYLLWFRWKYCISSIRHKCRRILSDSALRLDVQPCLSVSWKNKIWVFTSGSVLIFSVLHFQS
jgi:hypothetical protein